MKNFLKFIISFIFMLFCFLSLSVDAREVDFYDFSDEAQAKYDIENQNNSYKNTVPVKPDNSNSNLISMSLPNADVLTSKGTLLSITKGTTFNAMLNSAISSESIQNNDLITAQLKDDWIVGSYVIAPEGSIIQGKVTKNQTAGAAFKNGSISINFDKIIKPDGEIINMVTNKVVVTVDSSRAKNIGYLVGGTALLSAASMGTSWEGLAVGAGYGAIMGLIGLSRSNGENVSVPEGTNFQITLASDIRIKPYEY